MSEHHFVYRLVTLFLGAWALAAGAQVNLMPNGGFENDGDGDGVPDGWIAQPFNFNRDTLEQLQAHIRAIPSHEEVLKQDVVRAVDGWPIARRNEAGNWGPYLQTQKWYERLTNEYLPQNSRFGQLPVPDGLDLGRTTCALSSKRPTKHVLTEPFAVEADTGYRLSFHVRTSTGSQTIVLPQVLDASGADPREAPLWGDHVLNAISLGWSWVPHWTRYELPFRTSPECDRISIRLHYYHVGYPDSRRIWYDDFRLVRDDSVQLGEIGGAANPEPDWPGDALERGFAVIPRPPLPLTYRRYQPLRAEIDRPVMIAAAPGQFASTVLFVRALKDLSGPLLVGLKGRPQLNGPNGAFIWGGLGGRVQFRVIHPLKLGPSQGQWEMRPHFLMPGPRPEAIRPYTRCWELHVPEGEGRGIMVTVHVPLGTTPGQYEGEIHLVAPGKDYVGYTDSPGPNVGYSVPLTVHVRDLELLEPDANFGMYVQTDHQPGLAAIADTMGFADQQAHGMNVLDKGANYAGTPWVIEQVRDDGTVRIEFGPFDSILRPIARLGAIRSFLYFQGADFSAKTQLAVVQRCREQNYPEPLFYAYDEPGARSHALVEVMRKQFGEARGQGLRTVTSGLDWRTQGEAYDVWILDLSVVGNNGWRECQARAAELGAEIWAYDCSGYINTHPRNVRFYTGLWTWAAGLKGNWIWEYMNKTAFSPSDTTPPETWHNLGFAFDVPSGKAASMSWEARRDGVNDYRYLHTLERAIATAAGAGKADLASVVEARKYLDGLRARVPLNVFSYRKRQSTSQKQFRDVAPQIGAAEYDAVQNACAGHVVRIRNECGDAL